MRTAQAAIYSFVVSCYIGCFYFGIGMLMTLAQGQDIGKFLGDFVVTMLIVFAFFTFAIHELQGAFQKLNEPRNKGEEQPGQKDRTPPPTDR